MDRISNDPKNYRKRSSHSSSDRSKEQPAATRPLYEFEVTDGHYLVRKKK